MKSIRILYFARLRDQLASAEEAYELAGDSCSVAQLKSALAEREGSWQQVFSGSQVLAAVNKTIASADTRIQAGDEVGFFPPVTGG